jgi:hypothetical protein
VRRSPAKADDPHGSGEVRIQPKDHQAVLEVIEMQADYGDWLEIKQWAETRDRAEVIATAYGSKRSGGKSVEEPALETYEYKGKTRH